MYGQKQAGRVWNEYLVSKLLEIGFQQSKFNECIFYKKDVIYLLYTDDSIIMGPDRKEIDNTIKDIQHSGLKLLLMVPLQIFLASTYPN